MSTISLNSKIAKVADPITTEIDGNLVLLGVDSGKYFAFDAISSDIWKRLDTYPVIADLCQSLVRDYEATPSVIQVDICRLLDTLLSHRLVYLVDE